MSNLRQIGEGLLLYANENRESYPPSLGDMFKNEAVPLEIFLLPTDTNRAGMNAARDQQADWINAHSDYSYLAAGLTYNTADASTILAAEKKASGPGDTGLNLLFGDGSVVWFPNELASELLKRNTSAPAAVPASVLTESRDQRQCAGNLRHIWQMILLYRYHHAGNYPSDFNALQEGAGVTPPHNFSDFLRINERVDLSCPSAFLARIAEAKQIDSATRKLPAWVYNQTDYVYVPPNLHSDHPNDNVVIAYEKDTNHAGNGMNILFMDGQVRWYSLAQAHELIQQNRSATHP